MALEACAGGLLTQQLQDSVLADDGAGETNSDTVQYPILAPDGNKIAGGFGSPRQCQQPGKERQFHDGAGLSSMGRWDADKRIWSETPFWKELRKETLDMVLQHVGDERKLNRACFEMAVRGEDGCDIVRNEELKNKIRSLWISLLKKHGSTQEGLDTCAEGQPFFLRLMKELLAFSGDVDREFLLEGEVGFPVGVLSPLPRTPHVYEEQTSWRLEEEPLMREEVWRSNYQSVDQHTEFVYNHFDEECAEGLMEKLTLQQARDKYGDKIAVSSLAVLVEDNHQGKRRIIHDATHGTLVNNRIRCRDKVRSPSAREKQYLLALFKQQNKSVCSLVGDISKAHRRFLHAPNERGLLACKVQEGDSFIYVNKVGTFGVACASYWWSLEMASSGVTTSKNFEQGLGRLGFAALALVWERPFLGPLYSWSAAVRNKPGRLRIPAMIRAILLFLGSRFEEGGQLQEPPPLTDRNKEGQQLLFYTDAKATEHTEHGAWIGGYKQDAKGAILEWFSEEVPHSWADWMTYKKDPKRVIATLELLASLVAVKLWMPRGKEHVKAKCCLKGMTDNLGNTFAISKWMSTKFPLTIFVMELSETLRRGNCTLSLEWVRRDKNQLADDLTNLVFDKFDMDMRRRWKPETQEWHVLTQFLEHSKGFHGEMKKRKAEAIPPTHNKKKVRKKLSPW